MSDPTDERVERLDEYQERTEQTAMGFATTEEADREEVLPFLALALNGEAGEVAEKAKKYRREDDEEYLREMEDELSDVLWYLARALDELDATLSDAANSNLVKLEDRQERDQITGSGDDR